MPIKELIKKYPLATGGTALGLAIGGLTAKGDKGKKPTVGQRIGNALAGGLGIGSMGASLDMFNNLMDSATGKRVFDESGVQIKESLKKAKDAPIKGGYVKRKLPGAYGRHISKNDINIDSNGQIKLASLIKLASRNL